MFRKLMFFLLLIYAGACFSQTVILSENFESGVLSNQVAKIKRYPDTPEVVSSDSAYPQAFPPPSGKFAARLQDKKRGYYGLGSLVAGPVFDLQNPATTNIAIEASLYLLPSPETTKNNAALLAISDLGSVEQYYRFGYANTSIYFQFFNSSNFSEALYDPDLGKSLAVPGWHTFTMRFSGADQINFFVDGKETAFSPINQKDIKKFQLGVLMWDKETFNPLFVDDLKIMNFGAQTSGLKTTSTEKNQPAFQQQKQTGAVSSIKWYDDINQAWYAAKQENKKMLLYIYSPSVARCAEFEQKTLNNPAAIDLMSKYIMVKVDGVKNTNISERFDIFKMPTLLLIDINLQIYWRKIGFCEPNELQNLSRY